MVRSFECLLLALLPVALAAPAPAPAQVRAPHPMITARASLTDRTPTRVQERDIVSSIEGLGSYLSSVLGTFPSYVASGVPNFFQDFPTGTAVESSLGISSSDLAATPTQVLNIPYVLENYFSSLSNLLAEDMQIGLIKAGTCDSTAMFSNSLTSPNRSWMTLRTFSWSAHRYSNFPRRNKHKHEISLLRFLSFSKAVLMSR